MAETELEALSHSNANPTSYRLYIPMPFKKKKHTFWIGTDRTNMIVAQSRKILEMNSAGKKKKKKKSDGLSEHKSTTQD